MSRQECFLILGGAGLVGKQIASEIATHLAPRKVVIASLFQPDVEETIRELKAAFPGAPIEWVGEWGNIFVREEFTHLSRKVLMEDAGKRDALFEDLFGDIDAAYQASRMVRMIQQHRPDVIVDSINTATAISYQDSRTASLVSRRQMSDLLAGLDSGKVSADQKRATVESFEIQVLSQALPQLVRHIQILHRAMCEVGTRLYLKIGTTGTGGMGLNIPYTHSEDRPSFTLMSKTAVAFAHTGLMFLMARTPNGPIVKEIKPAAMIGYADVITRTVKERGEMVHTFTSRTESLGAKLTLRESEADYQRLGTLDLPIVDTGENGLFARGEFETITSLRQMEFVTPEEIASETVLEIRGSNTGRDVIAEVDSGIMNSTYRAGYLRQQVLADMSGLEESAGRRSVALGQLGPPELSKLLWEAELLRGEYGTLDAVLTAEPEEISSRIEKRLDGNADLRQTITSIGVPILTADGRGLIRGPRLRIPELPGMNEVPLDAGRVDQWAGKGWVDLRPANFAGWQHRFARMKESRRHQHGRGSAANGRETYVHDDIRIGEVVGWILNNEKAGYRIK